MAAPAPPAHRGAMRDDLFTHIHRALRKGLFDVTVAAGATDWTDPADRTRLAERWRPLAALLRSHTRHEDDHILRLLDAHDARPAAVAAEQHHDLDDLLDELDATVEAAVASGTAAAGLTASRDLARFVAAYLPHLHQEETQVMPAIWAACTDDEIAAARMAFMAEIAPEEMAYTIDLMLPALDPLTRSELLARA